MAKTNCWEFKKCERAGGGSKVAELGICPTVAEARLNGTHGGHQGGRACWVVAGTLCGGEAQGSFAQKYASCDKCDFYNFVRKEEGSRFVLTPVLLSKIRAQPAPA